MSKRLDRRGLLIAAAPIAAVPLAAKVALGDGASVKNASPLEKRSLSSHQHGSDSPAPAAMWGGGVRGAGEGGALAAFLSPPPPLSAEPGRVREYTLTAVDRDVEIAPGVFFPA